MTTVYAGVLTDSKSAFEGYVSQASEAGIPLLIDVLDGAFGESITVLPNEMNPDWFGDLSVDMQLMVEEPVTYVSECAALGVERAFGHVEVMRDQVVYVDECMAAGVGAGLAVDLGTPIEILNKTLWERLGGILLMSVPAGRSGQQYDRRVEDKIIYLRNRGYAGEIIVDGGINRNTIGRAAAVGADGFSVTSELWNADSLSDTYQALGRTADEYYSATK